MVISKLVRTVAKVIIIYLMRKVKKT